MITGYFIRISHATGKLSKVVEDISKKPETDRMRIIRKWVIYKENQWLKEVWILLKLNQWRTEEKDEEGLEVQEIK